MTMPCESCSAYPDKTSCTWKARAEQLSQAKDAGVNIGKPLSFAIEDLREEMAALECVRAQGNKKKGKSTVEKMMLAPTEGLLGVRQPITYFLDRDAALNKPVVKIPWLLDKIMNRKRPSHRETLYMKKQRRRQDSLARRLNKD